MGPLPQPKGMAFGQPCLCQTKILKAMIAQAIEAFFRFVELTVRFVLCMALGCGMIIGGMKVISLIIFRLPKWLAGIL